MKSSDREFIAESEEILEEAETYLLDIQDKIEEEPDPDSINALFRCMHTLKGMSGLYGFQGMSDISHALENLLDDIRLGRVEMEERVLRFLLKQMDVLKGRVKALSEGSSDKERDVSRELENIERFRSQAGEGEGESPVESPIDESILRVLSEYEEHRLKDNIKRGRGIYLVRAVFSLMDFDERLKALNAEIKKHGESISTMPTSEGVPDGSIGFSILSSSTLADDELASVFEADVAIEQLIPPHKSEVRKEPRKERAEAATQEPSAQRASSSTVRVDIEKLDTSLNTIAELSVSTNSLKAIWQELSETMGHNAAVIELYRVLQNYERRLSELKGQILQIRMVPVSQIYQKLGQVIRRAARSIEKDIRMEVFGEDTEIDKFLAEEMLDPLVHVVRNALDHGIEPPDEREELGKPKRGTIKLKSFQRGNNVVIEVSDDGRGLDPDKIRMKAADKGLIGEKDELGEQDIFALLFRPGFSTSDSVNELSGRGVGLDVVKERLSTLGGVVEVSSRKGTGTTFHLTLPITLAIVKSMIVRIGNDKFAVPLSSMSETLVVERGMFQEVEKSLLYDLRGDMLPVKSLRHIMGIAGEDLERPFAVVAGMGERRVVLLVDELMGQQEIVIKSIGDYFEGVRRLAGAAEISREEVILVLDVESIVSSVFSQQRGATHV